MMNKEQKKEVIQSTYNLTYEVVKKGIFAEVLNLLTKQQIEILFEKVSDIDAGNFCIAYDEIKELNNEK